jgi:hypothetical protein
MNEYAICDERTSLEIEAFIGEDNLASIEQHDITEIAEYNSGDVVYTYDYIVYFKNPNDAFLTKLHFGDRIRK